MSSLTHPAHLLAKSWCWQSWEMTGTMCLLCHSSGTWLHGSLFSEYTYRIISFQFSCFFRNQKLGSKFFSGVVKCWTDFCRWKFKFRSLSSLFFPQAWRKWNLSPVQFVSLAFSVGKVFFIRKVESLTVYPRFVADVLDRKDGWYIGKIHALCKYSRGCFLAIFPGQLKIS